MERAIFDDGLFGKLAAKLKPENGYYDVALHGLNRYAQFFGTNIGSDTLAKIIKSRSDYNGEPIRLISCSTGKEVESGICFAQELVNYLKVKVIVPNDIIWVKSNGTYSLGKNRNVNSSKLVPFYPKK